MVLKSQKSDWSGGVNSHSITYKRRAGCKLFYNSSAFTGTCVANVSHNVITKWKTCSYLPKNNVELLMWWNLKMFIFAWNICMFFLMSLQGQQCVRTFRFLTWKSSVINFRVVTVTQHIVWIGFIDYFSITVCPIMFYSFVMRHHDHKCKTSSSEREILSLWPDRTAGLNKMLPHRSHPSVPMPTLNACTATMTRAGWRFVFHMQTLYCIQPGPLSSPLGKCCSLIGCN